VFWLPPILLFLHAQVDGFNDGILNLLETVTFRPVFLVEFDPELLTDQQSQEYFKGIDRDSMLIASIHADNGLGYAIDL